MNRSRNPERCQWLSGRDAFRLFATYAGGTQSARHIKPLHWYISCRLVLEGGFSPDDITPRPPFDTTQRGIVSFQPQHAGSGEEAILGALKTKNVDIVVTKPRIGPVLAISCKGTTKAFRNLTNRMEETIGECTNLHITYPAMVIGYFVLLRANRTIQDVLEAPEVEDNSDPTENETAAVIDPNSAIQAARMERNDIAISLSGEPNEEILRFHAALTELTGRRGIRDEISRYEAISLALIEPRGDEAGAVFGGFPQAGTPLHHEGFFEALYQQYDERFVFGAPSLASRTRRRSWHPNSPVFLARDDGTARWPVLDYRPRLL